MRNKIWVLLIVTEVHVHINRHVAFRWYRPALADSNPWQKTAAAYMLLFLRSQFTPGMFRLNAKWVLEVAWLHMRGREWMPINMGLPGATWTQVKNMSTWDENVSPWLKCLCLSQGLCDFSSWTDREKTKNVEVWRKITKNHSSWMVLRSFRSWAVTVGHTLCKLSSGQIPKIMRSVSLLKRLNTQYNLLDHLYTQGDPTY